MRSRTCIVILLAAACVFARRAPHRAPSRAPAHAAAFTADDVQNATHTGPLGPGASGARVMRAQILLDRARFSPGEIDAHYGRNLAIAIKGYQQAQNQSATGTIDAAMWTSLNADTAPLFQTYTITAEDVKGPFHPVPADIHERARLDHLGYASPQELLGEKFHVSPKLLASLNPGKTLSQAGELIVVPKVDRPAPAAATRVEVSASQHTVSALDSSGAVLAQYPATMGGPHDPLPVGNWTIANIEHNPVFYYQPGRFWNADPNDAKEKIAPGPNNPVGVVWMGLSKRHYGIHGTPDPSLIGHAESYGCIRLTNWDAADLARMVRRGTPAILKD
jgi:lipoprotein-anchoring transpeptidase ErfK/SrfK